MNLNVYTDVSEIQTSLPSFMLLVRLMQKLVLTSISRAIARNCGHVGTYADSIPETISTAELGTCCDCFVLFWWEVFVNKSIAQLTILSLNER